MLFTRNQTIGSLRANRSMTYMSKLLQGKMFPVASTLAMD